MLRVLDLRERTPRGKRSHYNLVSAIKSPAAPGISIEFAPISVWGLVAIRVSRLNGTALRFVNVVVGTLSAGTK